MRRTGRIIIHILLYLVAIFMVVAGIETALGPLEPAGDLGFLFETRFWITIFGAVFSLSGFTLLIGLIRRKDGLVQWGTYAIFCCLLFAGVLNSVAFNTVDPGNFIAAGVLAALYLFRVSFAQKSAPKTKEPKND